MAKKKKKSTKAKRATGKTTARTEKSKTGTKSAKKAATRSHAKRTLARKKKSAKKGRGGKIAAAPTRGTQRRARGRRELTLSSEMLGPDSAGQSGDLQGLSKAEGADSESVDELIEEGNAFEAGIVAGVEESGERGMKEVRTREVPEDDVPGEYLDED